MKHKLILVTISIYILIISCASNHPFSYSPYDYLYDLQESEISFYFNVDKIPKNILKKLNNSSRLNFLLANPNEDYLKSKEIIVNNLPYRKLIFFGKSKNRINIICYETSGYEKRAIIYKEINGRIKGTFSVLFDSDNIDTLNFKEQLKQNKYKIIDIY